MREVWARSTPLGKILFPLALLIFVGQLFFVADYSNDKTVRVEQMAKSHSEHGGLSGRDIACRDPATKIRGTHAEWAEEFPVFPYAAVAFSKVLPGDAWRRWTPWFFFGVGWCLLGFILNRHAFAGRSEFLEILALYALLPIFVIHATKTLPDAAVLTLSLVGIALFLSSRKVASLPWFFLAGLVKPLALATVGPFALGWMLFGSESPKRRALWGLVAGGATVLGVLSWIGYLYAADVDNPLIRNAAYRAAMAPGEIVASAIPAGAYFSRYFTWIATRGLSWPIFLLALAGGLAIIRMNRREFSALPTFVRVASVMALFSPVYWILVRGPQYSGPWYSLYVMPGLFTLGAFAYARIPKLSWRVLIAALVLASSVTKVDWTPAGLDVYRAPFGTAFRAGGDEVDCDIPPIIRAVF